MCFNSRVSEIIISPIHLILVNLKILRKNLLRDLSFYDSLLYEGNCVRVIEKTGKVQENWEGENSLVKTQDWAKPYL